MKAKYQQVVELVKRRVSEGDYAFSVLPSERRLAQETGVSYMTARRAVQELLGEEIFIRGDNGRLLLNDKATKSAKTQRVALIIPSWISPTLYKIRLTLKDIVLKHNGSFRVITYDHPDDPAIYDALDGDFDLIYIQPNRTSDTLKLKLTQMREKVISISCDLSDLGILSVDGVSPSRIEVIIQKLYELGHREIAFFNTQPGERVIEQRLECWQKVMSDLGLQGTVINSPVNPFENSIFRAYEVFTDLVKADQVDFTAVYCTTVPMTRGVLRAMHEAGLRCPGDVSICSIGELAEAKLSIPAISVVDHSNLTAFLDRIHLQFMNNEIEKSKQYYCPDYEFYPGESIGPVNPTE